MIARIWQGRVPVTKKNEYIEFLKISGLPDYSSTDGNLGVELLCSEEGDIARILLISYWESRDVIREFAGDDIEVAKYYPEDKDFLLEFEPKVRHFEVIQA